MINEFRALPARLFWLLQVGGWAVYVLIKGVAFPLSAAESVWIVIKGVVLTTFLRYLLHRVMAWPNPWLRFGGAGGMTCAAGTLSLGVSLLAADAGWVFDSPAAIAWLASAKGLLFEWLVYLVWTAAYLVIRYGRDLAQTNRHLVEALKQVQLKHSLMLRYQINPHFLFNSMASLRALVFEEPGRSASFVDQLAGFLRHCLADDCDGETSLREEVEAMTHYLAIQKTRFERRIEYRVEMDPTVARVRVPTLLLQPLIENAVKHGRRACCQRMVLIRLTARAARNDRCIIEIRNTGSWPATGERGAHTRAPLGLANVRARLAAQVQGRWSFSIGPDGDDVIARIELPDRDVLKNEERLHA